MIWKVTAEDIGEIPEVEESPAPDKPKAKRYRALRCVSLRRDQFYKDEILPDGLFQQTDIEWLLKKGAVELVEE